MIVVVDPVVGQSPATLNVAREHTMKTALIDEVRLQSLTVRQSLEIAVQRILAVTSPSKIILFGSQARGDADSGSDIDLMVLEPMVENTALEAVRLYRAVGWVGIGVDILVYSDAEFDRRSTVPGTVLHQALTEGKVVYEPKRH